VRPAWRWQSGVYLVFFLSGAAALVYEVSWARQVGLILGHTAHAAAVVLAAYFAGLAVGYDLGGRLARRLDPRVGYAVAEFVVAGWACVVPSLLAAGPGVVDSLSPSASAGRFLVGWAFSFVLLLPATASLGATLPFMAGWLSPGDSPRGDRVVAAYACNTAGAFVGVVTVTCGLLVTVGVTGSGFVAAGVSVFCGVVALLLPRPLGPPGEAAPSRAGPNESHGPCFWPLFPAALSGFGILALEVLYARLFSLVFHNSTYTFGAVLATVILALALGPVLARVASRRARPGVVVAWAAGAGGVAILLSVWVFVLITRLDYLRPGGFVAYLAGAFGLVALVVLPPMTLLGMILPALWGGDTGTEVAERVGRTALVSTLAGAAGAGLASLVFLPVLGLWGAFLLVAFLFAALALGMPSTRHLTLALGVGVGFCFAALPLVVPPGPERWATAGPEVVLARWHSAYGWIDVVEGADGARKVRQNLHYRFGSTGTDAIRTYRQAHLPLVLHPRPADVLFLGLGTGMTAGAAIPHAEVERAVAVELIPEVVDAARLLADANFGFVDHPQCEVVIDDARRYVRATGRQFDVIVADLFVPWESETGYLYTAEHFRAVRRRLKPGGLFCQWLPLYQLGPREFELIADSFASAFPDVSLWWGHLDSRRPILALVGGAGGPRVEGPEVDARLRRAYRSAPADGEMKTARDLVGLYVGQWVSRRPDFLNTDEFPRVEFLTPVSDGDRVLLQGEALRQFSDEVLTRLPDRSDRFAVVQDPASVRRAWQRIGIGSP